MKQKSKIMKEMRQRREEEGLKRREFYLTDDEHSEMKKYLQELRNKD